MSSDFSFGTSLTIAFSCLSYRVGGTARQCQFLGFSGDIPNAVAVKNCDGIEFNNLASCFKTLFEKNLVPIDFVIGFGLPGISGFTILRRLEVGREQSLPNIVDGCNS